MMKTFLGLMFLVIAGTALADPVKTTKLCDGADLECLKNGSELFNNYLQNIDDLDPLAIPAFDVEFDESIGVTFKLRNLHVTGLKNQKAHEFKYNEQTKTLLFAYETHLFIGTDVFVDFTKKSKTFEGYFTSEPTVIGTFSSEISVKKNDQGEDYFDLGQETFTYKLVTAPQLDWNEETKQELDNDVDWKNQSEETFKKISEKTIDEIVTKAFKFEIENIRAALSS